MRQVGKLFFLKGSDKKVRWKESTHPQVGGGFGKKMEYLMDANPFKRPLLFNAPLGTLQLNKHSEHLLHH